MITKNQIKNIRGLALKKNRTKEQCFIIEGEKIVAELLSSSFQIINLFATKSWIAENKQFEAIASVVTNDELARISNLKSPNKVVALVKIPKRELQSNKGITLVLDTVNDPGNLGTIIRMCDWFGVDQIICSKDTVDVYNPKVVQASMGSLLRVNLYYTDLKLYLDGIKEPIYGAFMDGTPVKTTQLPKAAHLVMGNEANGISVEIEKMLTNKITIKNIGGNAESLNVAVATSILLHEFCN